MAAPTREQLKQRIRDYLRTYDGIGTDCTDGDTPTRFPAYDVQFADTSRIRSGGRDVKTYSIRVYIYACVARDVTKDKVSRADRAIAEAYIDPIAEFINDNPLFKMMTKTPITMPVESSAANDAGVGLLDLNDIEYAGFALEFTSTMG